MLFKPKYLPPKPDYKKRKKRKVLLVVFLLILISVIVIFLKFFKKEDKGPILHKTETVCNLSQEANQKLFEERDELEFQHFTDAFFYGESLTITKNPYDIKSTADFAGDTYQLKNICTNEVHSFLLNNQLDTNITVNDLPEGFYEVIIQENLKGKRLISKEPFSREIITVTRNNERKKISLFSDNTKFTNIYTGKPLLNQHELFIEVKKEDINKQIADIVLDPAYHHQDFEIISRGYQSDSFDAAFETYQIAQDVKKKLETKGLVVSITRNNPDEIVNTYKENGRVARALKSKAKYMVEISFGREENKKLQGTRVYGSLFASTYFQEFLMKPFIEYNLPVYVGQRNQQGVFRNRRYNDLDSINVLRESGGQALGAGLFSERSKEENKVAINNPNGIHTVSLEVLLTSNPDFETVYRKNYQKIIDAIVKGILYQLEIESNS